VTRSKVRAPGRITPNQLRDAAQVAREQGVTITIEAAGRVYRIAPGAEAFPMTATEKERQECDAAFGRCD
jgi:hypothetical protein